jgi:hypothetical protein
MLTATQPYLDSDMQSRWYEYGGDTIIRTDQYASGLWSLFQGDV